MVMLGTTLLYAALGEILTERTGMLNLGVEGMMLVGAVSGFYVAYVTGNPLLGVVAALIGGAVLALLHAYITISLHANQIVSGLSLTIFGTGLSQYLGAPLVGLPLQHSLQPLAIPLLSSIPIVGPILFQQNYLVYATYILIPLAWYVLFRTRIGLHMRAVGENPATADAMGVNVVRVRYIFTVIGGALCGLGGVYLSLAYAPTWLDNMTAGRGWIAIALVMFARWNPLLGMVGAYAFGLIDILALRMQALGTSVPSFFLAMLPYIMTILILAVFSGNRRGASGPLSLGLDYDRESQ